MNKEEISILNYLKQYLQDKIDDGYHKLFYGENDYDFKTIDAINAIEELQHQLEEKDKVIDEIEKRCIQEISAATIQYERHKRSDTWQYIIAHKRILETLERGKNVNSK